MGCRTNGDLARGRAPLRVVVVACKHAGDFCVEPLLRAASPKPSEIRRRVRRELAGCVRLVADRADQSTDQPAGTSSLSDAYRYGGWGQQLPGGVGSSTNPYRYRGLLNLGADDLAGALLSMGARDYSSQLGTFTREDSVAGGAANPMTMNRFLYALANPVTLVDPDGHMAEAGGGATGGTDCPPCGSGPRTHRDDCSRKCAKR